MSANESYEIGRVPRTLVGAHALDHLPRRVVVDDRSMLAERTIAV